VPDPGRDRQRMDYYSILGVTSDASSADIKRAYRRLSRRFHPGINPGDRAAAVMFQQIAEAYETLADPDRRRQYDAGSRPPPRSETTSFEFTGFDFTVSAHGAQAATFSELFAEALHPVAAPDPDRAEIGSDIHAALTVSFAEAVRGVERQVVVTRQVPCGACQGSGHVRSAEGRCSHCHATGKVRWARGHMVFAKACAACGGTGRQRFERCGVCAGHGRGVRSEAIAVHVPAGVVDGARLRLAEKGHAGRWGGRTGDLYVEVHVQPHPVLRREGNDLVMPVPVAVHEAVLGAKIDLPTLDGGVKLRIPPGTQAGQRFRFSGRGVPANHGEPGDLLVEVRLVLPALSDERSKDLMREFGRINSQDVRRDLRADMGGERTGASGEARA
jgi:molecular chaperone DnaJ